MESDIIFKSIFIAIWNNTRMYLVRIKKNKIDYCSLYIFLIANLSSETMQGEILKDWQCFLLFSVEKFCKCFAYWYILLELVNG